jgi:hypothetical protein
MEDMERLGYKKVEVNNTWLNKNKAYNGVNTNFGTPQGYIFELQFHTPESLKLKNKLHPIYEKLRVAKSQAEAEKLNLEMLKIAEGEIIPYNIETILPYSIETIL